MIDVTGVGPWPGEDPLEAQTAVCGEVVAGPYGVSGTPWVVRLPDRGPTATLAAQGLSVLVDLPAELGPHGWQLADRAGRDAARLAANHREHLDALAVAAHGWTGSVVLPVCGPYTLAASVYLARGDRVVADHGAVAEVVASFGVGLSEYVAALRRAVPGATPVVALQEPLLAAALAGTLPSFSGYAFLRALSVGVVTEGLTGLVGQLRDQGVQRSVVQVGSATLLPLLVAAGVPAAGIEVATLDERRWESVAEAVESGLRLWAHMDVPTEQLGARFDPNVVADPVVDEWRRVGLPAADLTDLTVVAPGISMSEGAGRSVEAARAVLAATLRSAAVLAERAESA